MTRHILVVDDEDDIRETVAGVLEEEGYTVERATNGAEALRAVERDRPALLLMDMSMPVMDGWGLAAALKAGGIVLPIVVMTAAKDAAASAAEVAADAYLAKPFGVEELLEVVERFCPA